MELYKKHRPTKFSEVIGQKEVLKTLVDFGKRKSIPHFLLFTGPSGCGKTTIARILKDKLNCGDMDFYELNVADFRGIDMVRDIRSKMSLSPMSGSVRIWLIDECHALTKDAMGAFLKMLEDTPNHVYFFLATTDPQKLLPTIRTRATELKVKALDVVESKNLVMSVAEKEGKSDLQEEVVDKIVDLAQGSPRKLLVLLDQVIQETDVDTALEALSAGVAEKDAIELARMLLTGGTWATVAKFLKSFEGLDEQAESIRWLILSYMSTVALNNPKQAERACMVIEVFRDNFYDCKRAGLIASCREVCS
jgi:DNA polymerase-3 subunit gamma/tau